MSFQRDFMGKILREKLKENGFYAYREIGECSDEIWLDLGCLFVVIYDKTIHTYRQEMVDNSYLKNIYRDFDAQTVKKILKEAEEWRGHIEKLYGKNHISPVGHKLS